MTSKSARALSDTGHRKSASSQSSSNAPNLYTPTSSKAPDSPDTTNMPADLNGANGASEHSRLDGNQGGSMINPRKYLNRKASSPTMPAFIVSAPGKVIVFGEHAVVHGKVRL